MIVVMTNGNPALAPSPDYVPAPPAPQAGTGVSGMQGQGIVVFANSLVSDVIPFIDKGWRTLADRENRAIAGLSMGGAMTLYAAFNHLDKFAC